MQCKTRNEMLWPEFRAPVLTIVQPFRYLCRSFGLTGRVVSCLQDVRKDEGDAWHSLWTLCIFVAGGTVSCGRRLFNGRLKAKTDVNCARPRYSPAWLLFAFRIVAQLIRNWLFIWIIEYSCAIWVTFAIIILIAWWFLRKIILILYCTFRELLLIVFLQC